MFILLMTHKPYTYFVETGRFKFFLDNLESCYLLGVKYAINSIFYAVSKIPAGYLRLVYKHIFV